MDEISRSAPNLSIYILLALNATETLTLCKIYMVAQMTTCVLLERFGGSMASRNHAPQNMGLNWRGDVSDPPNEEQVVDVDADAET